MPSIKQKRGYRDVDVSISALGLERRLFGWRTALRLERRLGAALVQRLTDSAEFDAFDVVCFCRLRASTRPMPV